MEKLNVKLIALDLDDTLLNNDRQISDENVAALQECARRGIYIVNKPNSRHYQTVTLA